MCGIVGIIDIEGKRDVLKPGIEMMEALQRRGQASAGVAWNGSDGTWNVYKQPGKVHKVLENLLLSKTRPIATSMIGHNRYATSGAKDENLLLRHAQPFTFADKLGEAQFAFGFNGNITNESELREVYENEGRALQENIDTEILRQMLIDGIAKYTMQQISQTFADMSKKLDGCYNVVLLDNGGSLVAYHDEHSFRPLSYAEVDGYGVVASEDRAIRMVWPHAKPKDVPTASVISLTKGIFDVVAVPKPAACYVEDIYFSDAQTTINGNGVSDTRRRLGRKHAEMDEGKLPVKRIVVPIPESGIPMGQGYYDAAPGTRLVAAVQKRRDNEDEHEAERTFIEPDGHEEKARRKYKIIADEIRGKVIVLTEDTIVRGSTLRPLIRMIREEAQPAEIHVRVGSPPITSICPYAIDIPTISELFVRQIHDAILPSGALSESELQKLADKIGADSLRYATVEAIPEVMRVAPEHVCMACVTGKYPTEGGRKSYQHALEKHLAKKNIQ